MTAKEKRGLLDWDLPTAPNTEIPWQKVYNCYYSDKVSRTTLRAQLQDNVLCITFFQLDKPLWRYFSCHGDWVSQDLDLGKSSTAGIEHILRMVSESGCILAPMDDAQILNQWAAAHHSGDHNKKIAKNLPLEKIIDWERAIRKARIESKNAKIKAEDDAYMGILKSLPKKFYGWVDAVAFAGNQYLFYKYSPQKQMQGYCTRCKQSVAVEKVRHGEVGKCPACGHRVKFIATGKMCKEKIVSDRKVCVYVDKLGNDRFCLREVEVVCSHSVGENPVVAKSKYAYHEIARIFMPGKFFRWGDFKQTGEFRFCRCDHGIDDLDYHWICPDHLRDFLKDNISRYIPIEEIVLGGEIGLCYLYYRVFKMPWLEYTCKAGLHQLTREIINKSRQIEHINLDGNSLPAILGISKAGIRLMGQHDLGLYALKIIQIFEDAQKPLPNIAEIRWIERNYIRDYLPQIIPYGKMERIIPFLEREGKKKIIPSWMGKQQIAYTASDYADYLREAAVIGLDLRDKSVCYPKDLQAAHERTSGLIKIQKNKMQDVMIKQYADALLHTHTFHFCSLFVRPAESTEELIAEGKKLRHCVAGYAERYAQRKCIILFIRQSESPAVPYYTMELSPCGELQQCRTLQNKSYECENQIVEFVKAFLAHLKKANNKRLKIA